MSHRPLPSLEFLRECFELDADSGVVHWKTRPISHFKKAWDAPGWNRAFAGRVVGNVTGRYMTITVSGHCYPSHRIIYALANGVDPGEFQVDHINRDSFDNRPANLRLATPSQNKVNTSRNVRGVYWHKEEKRWRVKLIVNGKYVQVGQYKDRAKAEEVAKAAREFYFGPFHPQYREGQAA